MSEKPKKTHVVSVVLWAVFIAAFASGFIETHLSRVLPGLYFDPLETIEDVPAWLLWVSIFALAGILAATRVWLHPIVRFFKEGDEGLRARAVGRLEGMYRFVIWLCVADGALTCVTNAVYVFQGSGQPTVQKLVAGAVVPTVVSTYFQVYFTILFIEPYLFSKVAPRLYDEKALYEKKKGLTMSVRSRLWLMILNLVVVPMALVALSLVRGAEGFKDVWPVPLGVVVVSLVYILGYCEMLYRTITWPLDELAKKMERVSKGDFEVKTSVLGDDEIGRIKAHFNVMVRDLAERERIRDTFGKFVSVEVAKQLMESGKIRLGGESIEATILFSDIRNFTAMSEKMDPSEVVEFLNEYFSYVTTPIMEHRGVINKFIGDAVMAVFAPQFGSEDHVGDALKAVLGMERRLAEYNTGRKGEDIRFGIGMHTGVLVAGNIGTESRLEYTLIGDTVNIASRIESETKVLKSTILVSDAFHDGLSARDRKGLLFEKCENIRVKGKEKPLTLYKVLEPSAS